MAGVDDGVVGKGEQPLADGDDDLVEVRVLPAGGSRAARAPTTTSAARRRTS